MKWVILQLTLNLILKFAAGQTYVGCSFETVEKRFLSASSEFTRQNEEYHNLSKNGLFHIPDRKFNYDDSLSAVYAQENLTYFVFISDIDTNKCSITCGFSCLVGSTNPFREENFYRKLTHIAIVDSRHIIIAFSKKISQKMIDKFTFIRPVTSQDSANYKNFYDTYSYAGRKGLKRTINCGNCTLERYYNIERGKEISITYRGAVKITKMIKNSFIYKKSAFKR